MEEGVRGPVARELTRRALLQRTGALGLGALVASALPIAEEMVAADPALAEVQPDHATLQAFADTVIPGRPAASTDLGDEIHPRAIAGVDPEPGAVEADALRMYRHPLVGFDRIAAPFLVDLEGRSLPHGGPFLTLDFDRRVRVVLTGLDFANGSRPLWELAAAVPFIAFSGAGMHPIGTSRNASGYRVMGYPGAAPNGHRRFSYRRRLARERTRRGNLA